MSKRNPMFSVIVAIYQVESFLPMCIESVLKQTFKDFELILVDDGSYDNGAAICDRYAETDNRIRVFHKPNGGLVSARKSGLALAKGTYIFNVDGDDWLETTALETLNRYLSNCSSDIILFNYYEGVEDNKISVHQSIPVGQYNRAEINELICPRMIYNVQEHSLWDIKPNIWCKVFRRELALQFQMQVWDDISFGEDVACVYPMLMEADTVVVIKAPLYNYRINMQSMVRAYDCNLPEKTRKVLYFLLENEQLKTIRDQIYYYGAVMLENLIKNELRNQANSRSISESLRFWCTDKLFNDILLRVHSDKFQMKHRIIIGLLKKRNYKAVANICVICRPLLVYQS